MQLCVLCACALCLSGLVFLQEHLIQLHKKLEFAERSDMARDSAALRDVAPELDKLRIKALFKAREFLIARWVPLTGLPRCRWE